MSKLMTIDKIKSAVLAEKVDQILGQVDWFELLCWYIAGSADEYNVCVIKDLHGLHYLHSSKNETPSDFRLAFFPSRGNGLFRGEAVGIPAENVIAVLPSTRGENAFVWEGYASYDEDGRLIIDETGEAVRDQAAFESDPLSYFLPEVGLEEFYDRFRPQLREQLLARLGGGR